MIVSVRRLCQVVLGFIAGFFLPMFTSAQLCQGSLGDPLINITFGSGPAQGPALAAASTSYQYVNTDCPQDGYYTVRSSSTSCFGNSWHSMPRDHTGDPNGYFMLVNASIQPSAFYLDTVKGLCGGTTYEFASWVANMLLPSSCSPNPTQPNLTFSLERTDGSVLQSYNTSLIPSTSGPTWKQYGFFFTTPTNVSDIVLRIFNNAPGGCGNDLALDDITFRPCGPEIIPSIVGSVSDSILYCEGVASNYTFTASISAGFNSPRFQWQQSVDGGPWTDIPGETTTSLIRNFPANTNAGVYVYRLSAAEAGNMSSQQCRVNSDPLRIQVAPNPPTNASSNSPVCQQGVINISAGGGNQYVWSGPGGFTSTDAVISIADAQPAMSGKYYVEVTNEFGCPHNDSTIVTVNVKPTAGSSFAETSFCEGGQVTLLANGGTRYLWSPSVGLSSIDVPDPIANPLDTVEYELIVFNQFDCSDTTHVLINVVEGPVANAGPDLMIIEGQSIQIPATAAGQNVSYAWTPAINIDNPNALQPIVTPPKDTSYVLSVTSNEGCGTVTDTMHVAVYKDVYVPNAFSPNNDGLNDTWNIPVLVAFPGFELSVYNRNGQLLFQTKDATRGWDGRYRGKMQPVGAYVYVLDLKNGDRLRKGTLMLIR